MFNRLKRLWALSQKDEKALKKLMDLTPEELDYLPPQGDGKAVFISEGTTEEFEEQEKKDKGLWGLFGGKK